MTSSEHTRSLVFTIVSAFSDGTKIITGVNPSVGFGTKDHRDDPVIFSWVRDPGVLLEAHMRRLKRSGRDAKPRVAPLPGDELRFMEEEWKEWIQRSVGRGERYHDPATDKYWLTWPSAFIFTWKLQEPVKSWRIRLRDRRARRLWRTLGMDQYQPTGAPTPANVHTAQSVAIVSSAMPDAAPSQQPSLTYQAALRENEIRQEEHPGGVIVRMGTQTLGAFLARRWINLLFIGLWLMLAAYTSLKLIGVLRYALSTPWTTRLLRTEGVALLVWLFFLIVELMRLRAGLRRVRGTITLSASPEGVRFEGAPSKVKRGLLHRDEIETLRVRLIDLRIRRSVYQLEAKKHGSNRVQPLLIARDQDALKNVRTALMRGMGIESRPE
jgi:hypothetical protein